MAPSAEASTSQRTAMQGLRRRQAAANEAANKTKPSATFGALGHGSWTDDDSDDVGFL